MSRSALDALKGTWIRIASSPDAAAALERWRSARHSSHPTP